MYQDTWNPELPSLTMIHPPPTSPSTTTTTTTTTTCCCCYYLKEVEKELVHCNVMEVRREIKSINTLKSV